jgi:Na+/proline symporter
MIDIIIFILFLVANLIIGIKYRGRSQSFKEYSIGDKQFSTATLTATMVATWASGSYLFNTIEQAYGNGLYFILASVGSSIGLLITGYIVGPRLLPFLNNVSVADIMGHIYGQRVQVIAAVSSVLKSIGFIAIQFKVISKVLPILFNYEGPELTILAATIITVYAAFGGVKAVTFTDVVQFITFGILLPVLALTIWHHIPSSEQIIRSVTTNPKFSLTNVFSWSPELMSSLVLMAYYATPGLPPQLFQRLIMSRDIAQMQRSIAYTTGIMLVIDLFIIWITILLLADNSTLQPSQVIQYMIDKHTYAGLKGLFGVGVIALAMSTADSALNASSVIVTNDILPPLRIIKKPFVSAAALSTLVLGFLGLILALYIQNILKILLLSANFYMPVIIVPMLLTIFGFRTSERAILIGIGAGCITTFCLLIYFKNINSFFPGMLANLVFLLGSHYLLREKGGWIKQQTGPQALDIRKAYPLTWKGRWAQLKSIKPLAYLQKSLPNKEHYYPLLAFYLLTATYVSLYNVPHIIEQQYLTLYRTIQYSILVITTSLLAFPIWPATLKNKRLLAWLWPSIILYALFFVGGLVMIMSGFQSDQVLIFMLNLVMTVLLIYWPLALTLAITGLTAAILVFNWAMGEVILPNQTIPISFHLGYGLLLFSSLLIALFRFKQANKDLAEKHEYLRSTYHDTTQNLLKARRYEERFIKALNTEGVEELNKVVTLSRELEIQSKKIDHTILPVAFQKSFTTWQEQLTATAQYLKILAHRTSAYLRLEVETTPIANLIQQAIALLQLQEIGSIPQISLQNHSKAAELEVDLAKIKQLLVNAILYAQGTQQSNLSPIVLHIEDTLLSYPINSIGENMKQIHAVCFTVTTASKSAPIEPIYLGNVDQANLWIPQVTDNLLLSTNQRIIEAHYGYLSLTMHDGAITQVYVIPTHLREVRPKEMDIPQMDVDAFQPVSDENYPGAAEQEAAFLEAVKNKTQADLKLVEKALRIIKKYHGPVKRKSGEPFYLHPVAVASIALEYTKDADTIIAALLHDLVEDTAFSLPQVGLMFNMRIQRIVDGVTHLYSNFNTLHKIKLAAHENIKKLLEVEDKGVLYVKLADRLHNMRTIEGHSSLIKQKQIAEETLQFFVPVAQYLELKQVMEELKKLSLQVLDKK